MSELKPCPFCGGVGKIIAHQCAEDACSAHVLCQGCGAKTDYFEDAYSPRPESIAAWNTRTRTFTKADVEAGCYAAIPEPTHLYEGRAADDVAQLKLAAGIDRLAFRSRLIAALSALGEVEG